MVLVCVWILLFGPCGLALAQPSPAKYLQSPHRSVSQNLRVLENLALKIQLNWGYSEGEPDATDWRMDDFEGLKGYQQLLRRIDGSLRTLEVGMVTHPKGGYEFVLHGTMVDGQISGPNPDLDLILAALQELVAAPDPMEPRDLASEIYNLSYIQADRAIALLKALGYTTVEYSQQAAENQFDKTYNPTQQGSGRLPIVVKLIDAPKTSIMDPNPSSTMMMAQAAAPMPGAFSAVPEIGGTFLHQTTSGEPQQRLLLLYDDGDPEPLQKVLQLLRDQVDVPARQIVIEALVIEVNSERLRDLGVSFESTQNKWQTSLFQQVGDTTTPFIFTFDKNLTGISTFQATLTALLERGEAEVLSKPSVLVLDGRQARIQIAQQVPVVKSTTTQTATFNGVEYFPVGIVLNLRPRINEDGSEITMQAEAIVSAVNSLATSQVGGASDFFLAPVVDSRQVETFVRVANDAPFIVGGLLSVQDRYAKDGIPFLSEIPGLGLLFSRTVIEKIRSEVIVVLTPHVVPLEEKTFSYVIPKDDDIFDTFGFQLFRNGYRLRGDDVFDLRFIQESDTLRDLRIRAREILEENENLKREEPFASLEAGGIPGEEILVRRMLWEVVDKIGYAELVDPDRIIFFEEKPDAADGSGFQLAFLGQKLETLSDTSNALSLSFSADSKGTKDHPFVQPSARVQYFGIREDEYLTRMIQGNRGAADGTAESWTIVLSEAYSGIRVPPLQLLRGILALKRILELNSSLPLTLEDFHVGREITFPSEEEMENRFHLVDRRAAQLFYEVLLYYPAFEQEFNRKRARVLNWNPGGGNGASSSSGGH